MTEQRTFAFPTSHLNIQVLHPPVGMYPHWAAPFVTAQQPVRVCELDGTNPGEPLLAEFNMIEPRPVKEFYVVEPTLANCIERLGLLLMRLKIHRPRNTIFVTHRGPVGGPIESWFNGDDPSRFVGIFALASCEQQLEIRGIERLRAAG